MYIFIHKLLGNCFAGHTTQFNHFSLVFTRHIESGLAFFFFEFLIKKNIKFKNKFERRGKDLGRNFNMMKQDVGPKAGWNYRLDESFAQ